MKTIFMEFDGVLYAIVGYQLSNQNMEVLASYYVYVKNIQSGKIATNRDLFNTMDDALINGIAIAQDFDNYLSRLKV